MSMPPAILDLRIRQPEGRPVHVWLPLFLLWPLALVLGVLALVLTILADVVLYVVGQPYHHYTLLLCVRWAVPMRREALLCTSEMGGRPST